LSIHNKQKDTKHGMCKDSTTSRATLGNLATRLYDFKQNTANVASKFIKI